MKTLTKILDTSATARIALAESITPQFQHLSEKQRREEAILRFDMRRKMKIDKITASTEFRIHLMEFWVGFISWLTGPYIRANHIANAELTNVNESMHRENKQLRSDLAELTLTNQKYINDINNLQDKLKDI